MKSAQKATLRVKKHMTNSFCRGYSLTRKCQTSLKRL